MLMCKVRRKNGEAFMRAFLVTYETVYDLRKSLKPHRSQLHHQSKTLFFSSLPLPLQSPLTVSSPPKAQQAGHARLRSAGAVLAMPWHDRRFHRLHVSSMVRHHSPHRSPATGEARLRRRPLAVAAPEASLDHRERPSHGLRMRRLSRRHRQRPTRSTGSRLQPRLPRGMR